MDDFFIYINENNLKHQNNMKKFKLSIALLVILLSGALRSCDNSKEEIGASWATVHVLNDDTYYLDSDLFGKLWIVDNDVRWYKPIDGERVISFFNPLSERYNNYDKAVKLEAIYPILTKDVVELTSENEDKLGNDPIVIYQNNLWISNGYMNIVFKQNTPTVNKHFINLVKGESITGTDTEYVYLELRYNTYNDLSGYWQNGAVSFDLSSIDFTNKKGVIMKLNSEFNGEVEVTINFNQNTNRTDIDYTRANTREMMMR